MDIDKITKRIINIIKNDYLFDIDDEEEYAIKSDIGDILQGEYNKLAIKALEDFREWILVNYEPAIVDLVAMTVVSHGKVNGWDEIDVDEMLEELHYELKERLLNVIDTFLKD